MADKDRIIENAVGTIKKMSLANRERRSENERLSSEVARLTALLRDREAEDSGMSFR
ncbi:hypothetical protein MPPM_0411 [Methylorubrum populi]|uniref:Uncharacterized protein n=1 Tax=Methylorubrum populi TaxID=223967 RepID=A0A169QJW8_9HYPH|nr:hypothetical protein MPPM_0411 [Methylorubrum populi]